MVPIFTASSFVARSIVLPPRWDYAKRVLKQNVSDAQIYRKNNFIHLDVRQDNFLRRFLLNYPVSFDLGDDAFLRQVKSAGMNFSMTLGVTSPISIGHLGPGDFLGGDCAEAHLYIDSDFTPDNNTVWENLKPIWYVDHPRTSLLTSSYVNQEGEIGVGVIAIDFVMLIYMYRKFLKEKPTVSIYDTRTAAMFLQKHVFPNMFESQIEIAIFNRLNALSLGKTPESTRASGKVPYPYLDADERIDSCLGEVMRLIPNSIGSYDSILQNCPSLEKQSMRFSLSLPDMADTYNVEWLLILSRLKMFDFLLRVGGEQGIHVNQHHITKLVRTIRAYGVFGIMNKQNQTGLLTPYFGIIDRLMELV